MNTLLQFMDASADSSDDGFVARASDFLGMEINSTSTVKLSFRGGQDRDSVNTAVITIPDIETAHDGTGSNPSFRDVSEVVAGLLNGGDKYYTVADMKAGTFIAPFTTTVVVANAVD
tara:strand:+ start:81 stop:431 length:351 start_codon:yes stop_codon:yes gene_type:complete